MLKRFKKLKGILMGVFLVGAIALTTGIVLDAGLFKIPIFGFHNVIEKPVSNESYLDYTTADLETFLNALVAENYWFLDTESLYRYFLTQSQPIPTEHQGQKPVMITFDDGWKSIKTYVLPLLNQIEAKTDRKVKIVLFLNPNSVNTAETGKPAHRAKRYINCRDINEGVQKGYFDIQSHGFSHKNLTTLKTDDLIIELSKGQSILKNCITTNKNTESVGSHLAYAYNRVNRKVINYAAKYYLSGYLYNNRILRLGWWRDAYRVPRLRVYRNHPPEKLIKLAAKSSVIK